VNAGRAAAEMLLTDMDPCSTFLRIPQQTYGRRREMLLLHQHSAKSIDRK